MLAWRRMLERGASRTLFHSPVTCINNIFNTFLKGNHSPVPTLRALWKGLFSRMRTTTRIMLRWDTASHTPVDSELVGIGRLRRQTACGLTHGSTRSGVHLNQASRHNYGLWALPQPHSDTPMVDGPITCPDPTRGGLVLESQMHYKSHSSKVHKGPF
jgi:hypothetical protein